MQVEAFIIYYSLIPSFFDKKLFQVLWLYIIYVVCSLTSYFTKLEPTGNGPRGLKRHKCLEIVLFNFMLPLFGESYIKNLRLKYLYLECNSYKLY